MAKNSRKKLVLGKETLRNLQDVQLRQVVGGTWAPAPAVEVAMEMISNDNSCSCPVDIAQVAMAEQTFAPHVG